ncbi:MAG: hypothetical protein P4L57_14500 [Rhizomicrobium sp.]|nr:hypothetical protein [Rhizomicrobium sp.]
MTGLCGRANIAAIAPALLWPILMARDEPFAALGLISHHLDEISERIVLVRPVPGGLEVRVLVPDERTSAPVVLFRLPPGKAKQWDSDREVVIAHDSVGVAWLAASSRQYYWSNGTFVCAQTTD